MRNAVAAAAAAAVAAAVAAAAAAEVAAEAEVAAANALRGSFADDDATLPVCWKTKPKSHELGLVRWLVNKFV